MVTKQEVLTRLSGKRAEFRRLGVSFLAVFGSSARDQAKETSDVDLLVEFEGATTFAAYMDLKFYLEELLGCKVDLVTRNALKPQMAPLIEAEAIRVPGL